MPRRRVTPDRIESFTRQSGGGAGPAGAAPVCAGTTAEQAGGPAQSVGGATEGDGAGRQPSQEENPGGTGGRSRQVSPAQVTADGRGSGVSFSELIDSRTTQSAVPRQKRE